MPNTLTPDIIRETALNLLARNPGGIRQSDLFKLTEQEIAFDYSIEGEHTIRNAIWNLETKYPELVIKKKLSHRNVVLFPSNDLIHDYARKFKRRTEEKIAEEQLEYHIDKELAESKKFVEEIKSAEERGRIKSTLLGYKLMEIVRYIEMSEVDELLDLSKKDIMFMDAESLEAAFTLKSVIEQLRKCRNLLVHKQKVLGGATPD